MSIAITIIILLICILLMAVILVQNSKGGGLSSSFAAPNQVMGVKGTADFLEKATWILVSVLVALCLLSGVMIDRSNGATVGKSENAEAIENATSVPSIPAVEGIDETLLDDTQE